VPIDYPGLNLVLARMARRRGIPVLFYVSPQLWAWGPWRVARLRRRVDRLLAILPFEREFFVERGIPTVYVGHPLVDRLASFQVPRGLARKIKGKGEPHLVGILPGSRVQEIENLLPVMMQAARALNLRVPGVRFVLPAPGPEIPRGAAIREILDRDDTSPIQVVEDQPHAVMKLARVCLVASGTATAELAFFKTPMVILYRVNRLTRWISRLLIRVPHIGMANILAGKRIVPEFLFSSPPISGIVHATEELLLDEHRRGEMMAEFDTVRETLGTPGASARAAGAILEFLGSPGITGAEGKAETAERIGPKVTR
jgi:lipid-A-disaccharide synthase